jgi:hypothetical protein
MFTLIHNGMDIRYFKTSAEVDKYINSIVTNTSVPCHKVYNRKIDKTTRLIRYRYNTLYEEDFLIDEDAE